MLLAFSLVIKKLTTVTDLKNKTKNSMLQTKESIYFSYLWVTMCHVSFQMKFELCKQLSKEFVKYSNQVSLPTPAKICFSNSQITLQ